MAGHASFLEHFHDQVRDDIAGSARTHADEDSSKQRQIKLLAFGSRNTGLANSVSLGKFVPGGRKIGRADAKFGREGDVVIP